jgi:hypothetical protein
MSMAPENANPYVEQRRRDLKRLIRQRKVLIEEEFGGYAYMARQVLMAATDETDLRRELERSKARPDQRANRRFERAGLNLRRWLLPEDQNVPATVERLRRSADRELVVGPNHLLGSEPFTSWGGGGAPRMAVELPSTSGKGSLGEALIAVLDTGISDDAHQLHPDLFAVLTDVTGDLDVRDDDNDGMLDSGAGHGTFILGILHRLLPDAALDVAAVLGTHGYGDDASLALGVAGTSAGIRNLSLGCYTHDNTEPPGLRAALDAAGADVAFVAAAGNHNRTDPFWPGAFSEVVAVAAVDTRYGEPVPAPFTNRGDWVDACAPGVDIHSHYVGGKWPGLGTDPDIEFTGWARWDGTSFAAPQVAAAIATIAASEGITPKAAAVKLLASLAPLPGHADLGGLYLPPVDLVFRP